jgi:hypothetical protein
MMRPMSAPWPREPARKWRQSYVWRALGLVGAMLGAGLLTPLPARGFSLDAHETLTRKAIDQLVACADRFADSDRLRPRIAALRAAPDLLIQCNRDQDRLVRKAAVWHFLPAPGKPALDPDQQAVPVCPLEPSLRPWFAALAAVSEQAAGVNAGAEAYALLGAMLHYLQDMAVPTHVLPVFHPTRWISGDAFDDHPVVAEAGAQPDCQRLGQEQHSDQGLPAQLVSLLEGTAASTRAAIAEGPGRAGPAAGWDRFWRREVAADGFSRYGCVGNRFGAGKLSCDGQTVAVEAATYQQLAAKLQTEAITASARAMLIFLRRLPPPAEPPALLCPMPVPCRGGGLCGARPREWRRSARWNVFAGSPELPVIDIDQTSYRSCGAWPLPFGVAAYVVAALVAAPVVILALLLRRWRRRRREPAP